MKITFSFRMAATAALVSVGSLFAGDLIAQTQFAEYAKLNLKNGHQGDQYGKAVAIDGNTMVVGMGLQGGAYIYIRNAAGAWTLQQSLNAGTPNSRFGSCVGISGDTVIVGSPGSAESSELAFIYTRSGTSWTEQAQLSVGAPVGFAQNCGISGDSVIVSAANAVGGVVYIFARSGTNWTQQAMLTAISPQAGDGFGFAVALDGDTAVVGVPQSEGSWRGSVHVFVRNGANWTAQQKLLATDGLSGDLLGRSVAIHGDTLVAGAPENGAGNFSGAAYAFTRSGTVWTQQQKLVTLDGQSHAYVGNSVAVENNTAIVGAVQDTHEGGSGAGSSYVFQRLGSTWTQTQKIVPTDIHPGDHFGTSIALSSGSAIVSSIGDSIGSNTESGSAYVFVTNPPDCNYGLSPVNSVLLPAAGGTGSFTVTTQPGCQWQASVQDLISWVATTDAGTGSGSVNFTVSANTDVTRRGQIIVNGRQLFWIRQASAQSPQAGDFDASFGNTGLVSTSLRTYNQAYAIAVQSDQKIVVVGPSFGSGQANGGMIVRYNADGTLDSSFDTDGIAVFDANNLTDFAPEFHSVVIQADGKIVAAGSVIRSSGSTDYLVVRFNSNGSLDLDFGTGGIVRTDIDGLDNIAKAMALTPDGKIVVAGSGLVRYNANGSLDTSFGGDGIVSFDPAGTGAGQSDVAVQSDGKIVIINLGFVARFNTNGTLDSTFDGDGTVSPGGYVVAIQPDGKIVIGTGRTGPGDLMDFAISRLNPNGSIDTGFGTQGFVQTDISFDPINESWSYNLLTDIVVQSNGKIIAIGSVKSSLMTGDVLINTAVVRYNADGTIDTSFGRGDGIMMSDFPANDVYAAPTAVALQPDGKIVLAANYSSTSYTTSFGVMRFLGDAQPLGTQVHLVVGWNLLGNSVNAPLNVAAVFGNSTDASTVWQWLAASSKWAFYTPAQADGGAAYAADKGYAPLVTINAGDGFWVNAKAAFAATLAAGTAIGASKYADSQDPQGNGLKTGWSLISIGDHKTPKEFVTAISALPLVTGTVPTSITTLWAWDADLKNWYFYAPSLDNTNQLATYITSKAYLDFGSKVLDPAIGFWVNHP